MSVVAPIGGASLKGPIMAKVTLSPKLAAGSVTVDAIPDEVKRDVEDIWTALQANPEQEVRVEEDTKDALLKWLRDAVSYGKQRMNSAGDSEKLIVRALPKRNLPDTVKYISIKRDIPGDAAKNTHKTARAAK